MILVGQFGVMITALCASVKLLCVVPVSAGTSEHLWVGKPL